jgi:hypothetical protein
MLRNLAREFRPMTTTVDVLAAAFKDAGTPFIVGHPGGESVELMEAARQRQMHAECRRTEPCKTHR